LRGANHGERKEVERMTPMVFLVTGLISLATVFVCMLFGDESRMDMGFFVAAGFLGAYGVVATAIGVLMLLFP